MRGGPARELDARGARARSRTAAVRAWAPRAVLAWARKHCDTTALLLAAGAFAVYMFFSWYTWVNFSSPSWDQGIFTQLADQYARWQFPPIVDIKGPGFNLWGDHFHPILLLTGPLFWLWPSGLSLLTLQAVLFGISVYPIARFARARVGSVPGTLIGVAYATSWGLTSALVVQFHEIAFAVPLLAFGLTAWLESRYRRAAVLISLLVFVKEDLGLTVACIGVLVALLSWRGARELAGIGAFLAAWGTAWFLAATQVILPAFNNSGTTPGGCAKASTWRACSSSLTAGAPSAISWLPWESWGCAARGRRCCSPLSPGVSWGITPITGLFCGTIRRCSRR